MTKRFRYNPDTDEVEEVGKAPARIGDWKALHADFSLGVEPESIDKAKALDRNLGAPYTDYNADGAPIFRSKQQYDKFLKAHGYVNKTSGKGHHALSPELLQRMQQRAKE